MIELICHALLNPRAEVVAAKHAFSMYPIMSKLFGAAYVEMCIRDRNRKEYFMPSTASRSIWAGRLVPVFFSVYISSATVCE